MGPVALTTATDWSASWIKLKGWQVTFMVDTLICDAPDFNMSSNVANSDFGIRLHSLYMIQIIKIIIWQPIDNA